MNLCEYPVQYREKEGIRYTQDVVFCQTPQRALKLDLALPLQESAQPRPAAVFIHGGSYRQGTYKMEERCFELARRGYIAASIDYRRSYEAHFPAQVIDAKTAIRWLRAHADALGLNVNRVGVWGTSAGAHIASLVGVTADTTAFDTEVYEGYSSRVQAVGDLFGPSNFNTMPPEYHEQGDSALVQLLGGFIPDKQELVALAHTAAYVGRMKGLPPFFIAHGIPDRVVTINQSEELYAALQQAGVYAEFMRVEHAEHNLRPCGGVPVPSADFVYGELGRFLDQFLK